MNPIRWWFHEVIYRAASWVADMAADVAYANWYCKTCGENKMYGKTCKDMGKVRP